MCSLAARLAAAKARSGLSVSVCLPARDEEATVGHTVATVRRTLMEHVHLVDEVIVIDDGSTDATAEAAALGGRHRLRGRPTSSPTCPPAPARATRSGSRCT